MNFRVTLRITAIILAGLTTWLVVTNFWPDDKNNAPTSRQEQTAPRQQDCTADDFVFNDSSYVTLTLTGNRVFVIPDPCGNHVFYRDIDGDGWAERKGIGNPHQDDSASIALETTIDEILIEQLFEDFPTRPR